MSMIELHPAPAELRRRLNDEYTTVDDDDLVFYGLGLAHEPMVLVVPVRWRDNPKRSFAEIDAEGDDSDSGIWGGQLFGYPDGTDSIDVNHTENINPKSIRFCNHGGILVSDVGLSFFV